MQLLKNFEVKTLDVRIWDICTCSLWKINLKLWMLKFHNLAKFLTISLLEFKIIYGCSKLLMRFPLVSLFLHFFAISNYNLYLWEDWYFPFFLLFHCLHLLLLLPNTTQARFNGRLLGSILPAGLFFTFLIVLSLCYHGYDSIFYQYFINHLISKHRPMYILFRNATNFPLILFSQFSRVLSEPRHLRYRE